MGLGYLKIILNNYVCIWPAIWVSRCLHCFAELEGKIGPELWKWLFGFLNILVKAILLLMDANIDFLRHTPTCKQRDI